MRIPSRRTFWLSAATLLVAIIACGWFLVPRSRINRENFNRVQESMYEDRVEQILGAPNGRKHFTDSVGFAYEVWDWKDGLSSITVTFNDQGHVTDKLMHAATTWEIVQSHAKNVAKKIGIKW
jgi:hypothetical protein